jgi:predicted RNA-binding Zn-ribbon protein involved in translation (DUF1610 family)
MELFVFNCPTCGARVASAKIRKHAEWHNVHGDPCDPEDAEAWSG